MQLAMVGLGRMGANMVRRLVRAGHELAVHDRDPAVATALAAELGGRVTACTTVADLRATLEPPRHVWVMVPAGAPTESVVAGLAQALDARDCVIDGGNTYYRDDLRRARDLAERSIDYVDVGVSGGVHGLARGYCLMIGGPDGAVRALDPVFRSLAPGAGDTARTRGRRGRPSGPELGYLHCGPTGAGHYAKMIHNGIEYGVMQAYAEGFDILRHAGDDPAEPFAFPLDDLAELWRRGSVISSWLLDLTAEALRADPELAAYSGVVQDSGEGRWTVQAAVERAVPAEVLTAALYTRFRSRQEHTFAEKVLSAMRHGFGGHVEPPKH